MAVTLLRSKALKAASKKLPLLGDKALASNLEAFGFSPVECYRQGAEEAQEEIVRRLMSLPTSFAPRRATASASPTGESGALNASGQQADHGGSNQPGERT